jgi:hypothetical protein
VAHVDLARGIPAVLFAAGGLMLVLVVMAQSRDWRGATHLTVALSGLVTLIVVAGIALLIAGLLPVLAGWGLVFALAMALLAMLHAN